MRVNHRCLDVLMPQQLLHRSDVIPVLQKVGGKGMPKRMTACLFVDTGLTNSLPHGALHNGFVYMVLSLFPSACSPNTSLGEKQTASPIWLPHWDTCVPEHRAFGRAHILRPSPFEGFPFNHNTAITPLLTSSDQIMIIRIKKSSRRCQVN